VETQAEGGSVSSGGKLPSTARGASLGQPSAPRPPVTPAAAPGVPRENIDALAGSVLARLLQRLEQAAEIQFQAYREKVVRFTDQSALDAEVNLQRAANWTEDQMVVSTEQKLGALLDRVQASEAMLETQLARFEALRMDSRTVLEDTDRKISENSQTAIEAARREVATNLREGVESTSEILKGECQALVLDAVTRTVNATLANADDQMAAHTEARLSQAYGELRQQQELMMGRIKAEVDQLAAAATNNLAAKFEAMAQEIGPLLRQEMEKTLQESAEQLLTKTSQSLQERLQALTQETLASAQEAVRSQAEAQVDSAIRSAPDKVQERLERLTQVAGVTLVKITGNQLQKLAGTLFESSSQTLRREVEQLANNLRHDLKALQATLEDQSRQQLLAISQSTIRALNQEALAGIEKFRTRLHTTAQESGEESGR
jgi:hypothetical protein